MILMNHLQEIEEKFYKIVNIIFFFLFIRKQEEAGNQNNEVCIFFFSIISIYILLFMPQ